MIFNDLVGNAITDAKGSFHIGFDESSYQEWFLDRNPHLFFKIFRGDELIVSTEDSVLWNINFGATDLVIEVPGDISLFSALAAIGVQVHVEQGHSASNVRLALFSDAREAKPVDYYSANISWGDGTEPTTGTISQLETAFSVTGSHTYTTVGRFSVDVTIYSCDGHAATATNRALIGSPNERFVAQTYLDLLHRPIDLDSLARWTSLLDHGTTHKQVVLEIENTAEYQTVLVERLYHTLLNRSPDASALSSDLDFLKAGGAVMQLKAGLLKSSEYFQRRGNGTGIGFLVALYQDLLGIGVKLDETTQWNQLENAASRSTIVTQLLESDESRSNLAQRLYQEFLNRPAKSQELEAISELLRHDHALEQITAYLLSTNILSIINVIEVDQPDLAIELSLCLDGFDGLIGSSTRPLLVNQIRQSIAGAHNNLISDPRTAPLADLIPKNSIVRSQCVDETNEKLGVWFFPDVNLVNQDKILNQLRQVNILSVPGSQFAIRFSAQALNNVLEALWDHLVRPDHSNRINTSGDPDPNGPIELKSKQLTSPQPDRIVLTVNGTFYTGRSDIKYVDFTVVYTDTLIANGNRFIICDSKLELKIDRSGINAWEDALSALIAFFVPFPFVVGTELAARGDFERKVQNEISKATPPELHLGCLAKSFFPTQFLIPNRAQKIVVSYDDVRINLEDGTGVLASSRSLPALQPRTPAVRIEGTTEILVNLAYNQRTQVGGLFSIVTLDLREPLRITWTAEGRVRKPNAMTTGIEFDIQDAAPDLQITRKVSVSVTDEDNQQATDTMQVSIKFIYERVKATPPKQPLRRIEE